MRGAGRRAALAQVLSARRGLGHAVQALARQQPARRGGSGLRRAVLHLFHGKAVELRRNRRPFRPRGQGLAGDWRRRRRQGRPSAAQHAHLRDLLLRRAESRRHRRQFQPALQSRRDRGTDSRQRRQDHGDARSCDDLREGGGDAAAGGSRQGRGRELPLPAPCPEIGRLQAAATHEARRSKLFHCREQDRRRAGSARQ